MLGGGWSNSREVNFTHRQVGEAIRGNYTSPTGRWVKRYEGITLQPQGGGWSDTRELHFTHWATEVGRANNDRFLLYWQCKHKMQQCSEYMKAIYTQMNVYSFYLHIVKCIFVYIAELRFGTIRHMKISHSDQYFGILPKKSTTWSDFTFYLARYWFIK